VYTNAIAICVDMYFGILTNIGYLVAKDALLKADNSKYLASGAHFQTWPGTTSVLV